MHDKNLKFEWTQVPIELDITFTVISWEFMQCIFSVVFPNINQEKALRGLLLCKKEELCVLCTVLFKAKKEAYDVV